MLRYASNTRCRPLVVLLRATQSWQPRRFADWSVRNGAYGMDVGRDAGANSRRYAAGRGVHQYAAIAGIGRLERHAGELLAYLERNQEALVHYAARRRNGEPISTAFVESSVNEIIAKRMNKKQQMRWNRGTVQSFLDVRTAVLNDTLEDAFRHRYPGFHPANGNRAIALVS